MEGEVGLVEVPAVVVKVEVGAMGRPEGPFHCSLFHKGEIEDLVVDWEVRGSVVEEPEEIERGWVEEMVVDVEVVGWEEAGSVAEGKEEMEEDCQGEEMVLGLKEETEAVLGLQGGWPEGMGAQVEEEPCRQRATHSGLLQSASTRKHLRS